MNSVNEGLYYNVPLLVIPRGGPPWIAKRVVELRAGIRLERGDITPQKLREAVKEILANLDYGEAARRVRRIAACDRRSGSGSEFNRGIQTAPTISRVS